MNKKTKNLLHLVRSEVLEVLLVGEQKSETKQSLSRWSRRERRRHCKTFVHRRPICHKTSSSSINQDLLSKTSVGPPIHCPQWPGQPMTNYDLQVTMGNNDCLPTSKNFDLCCYWLWTSRTNVFAFWLTSRNAVVYKLLRWCSEKQNIISIELI